MLEGIETADLTRYQAFASIAQSIVAVLAAIVGALWTAYHFYSAGFRPKGKAWIDENRLAIKVKIYNKGRTDGTVPRPNIIMDSGGRMLSVTWVQSPETNVLHPNQSAEYLAVSKDRFPKTTLVRFTFNEKTRKDRTPHPVEGTWPRSPHQSAG